MHLPCMEYTYITHGTRLHHAWNTPVSCMEYACTMHGIHLCHTWNTPAPCTCVMHRIHLYHAWKTPVPRMEYAWNGPDSMHGTCTFYAWNIGSNPCMWHAWYLHVKRPQIPACYIHVSGIMHGIANSSILSLEILCMKITRLSFSCMKCAETCMFQVLHFE